MNEWMKEWLNECWLGFFFSIAWFARTVNGEQKCNQHSQPEKLKTKTENGKIQLKNQQIVAPLAFHRTHKSLIYCTDLPLRVTFMLEYIISIWKSGKKTNVLVCREKCSASFRKCHIKEIAKNGKCFERNSVKWREREWKKNSLSLLRWHTVEITLCHVLVTNEKKWNHPAVEESSKWAYYLDSS